MLRTISFALLSAVASLSGSAYSMAASNPYVGTLIDYDLVSKKPQLFINYLMFPVKAKCIMTSSNPNIKLIIEGVAKKGTVDERPLVTGSSIPLTLKSGEALRITAEAGAQVRITNQQDFTVHTKCNAMPDL